MLGTHTFAQFCATTRHMVSCDWLECVRLESSHVGTHSNQSQLVMWRIMAKVVQKCVSLAFFIYFISFDDVLGKIYSIIIVFWITIDIILLFILTTGYFNILKYFL